ncbi:MAG: hypothetical protein ACLUFB_08920 [Ruminococcus sp.]|uniref:hypothetical protein n=1 Tax=Ruminococcus sp. TaxID=41978 RepID=UPI002660044B|nr:hypothetical protein [uncultured Ruminococcus sp.]
MHHDLKKEKMSLLSFGTSLVGVLMIVISFFLPFASATAEYGEKLERYSDSVMVEKLNWTGGDLKALSLLKFARLYSSQFSESVGADRIICMIDVTLICIIALFSLLTLLFVVLKKPIPTIVFHVLNFVIFRALAFDLKDRNVVGGNNYHWGAGYVLYHIGFLVGIAGAVWFLVRKIKQKRMEAKSE